MNFSTLTQIDSAEERAAQANYNKGFAARKALLGLSATVSTEIPLNRYGFFGALHDELLPNTRLELNLELESDGNLIWQAGANCRVIVTKMQLLVPQGLLSIQKVNHYTPVNSLQIKNGHI